MTDFARLYTDEMHVTLVDAIEFLDGIKDPLPPESAAGLDALIAKLDAITWVAPQDVVNVYRQAMKR